MNPKLALNLLQKIVDMTRELGQEKDAEKRKVMKAKIAFMRGSVREWGEPCRKLLN